MMYGGSANFLLKEMSFLESQQSLHGFKDKIKIVRGFNFVTIEDTKNLTNEELVELLTNLMEGSSIEAVPIVTILIDSHCSHAVHSLLKEYGFMLHDEIITVYKDLRWHVATGERYTIKNMDEIPSFEFKRVWKEAVAGSLNAPSSLTIDEQIRNAELELGAGYRKSCLLAYDKGKPIGILMPHIEAGTLSEGRLFYFGIIPGERGKGRGLVLHRQALDLLKKEFGASHYIGSTSSRNNPMLKTFVGNGCKMIEKNSVYKRINQTLTD